MLLLMLLLLLLLLLLTAPTYLGWCGCIYSIAGPTAYEYF